MDVSSAGVKEGLIKALKVVGWIAASGAVTALISYTATLNTTETAIVYAIVNPLLVFIKTWLDSKCPIKK
jgi:hypothetical protein